MPGALLYRSFLPFLMCNTSLTNLHRQWGFFRPFSAAGDGKARSVILPSSGRKCRKKSSLSGGKVRMAGCGNNPLSSRKMPFPRGFAQFPQSYPHRYVNVDFPRKVTQFSPAGGPLPSSRGDGGSRRRYFFRAQTFSGGCLFGRGMLY